LNKILAPAGVASRRGAEELILQGRVQVNGRVVTELGTKVDPKRDQIRVDGQRIQVGADHVYVLLNKPKGILSVMEDPRGRTALGDLISVPERLYPVGRLDANSLPISWSVQLASLSSRDGAQNLQKTLRSQGYNAYIRTVDGMNRVFVGPLIERGEADRLRDQLNRQHKLNGFVVRFQPESS
jgi:cell division septation protein DedD